MGLPQLKHGGNILDDWATWEGRWELIHGVAFDMPPAPSMVHQEISSDRVVEILSPGTAAKDTVRKRWLYEASGVPEYLIVDPENRESVLLKLDEQKRYVESAWVSWGDAVELLGGQIQVRVGSLEEGAKND